MNVSISITGAKELERKLKQLEPKVAKKIVRQSLRKAAKPILTRAKQLVPVITGALKKSLKVRAMRRKKGRYGIMVGTAAGWFVGKTFYGGFVEFGTDKAPARAFVRPAFDSQKARAEAILKTELLTAVNSAGKGK